MQLESTWARDSTRPRSTRGMKSCSHVTEGDSRGSRSTRGLKSYGHPAVVCLAMLYRVHAARLLDTA